MMMGPMSSKDSLLGPFSNTLITLQPLKLALELPYELITDWQLILQGGQAFHLRTDLFCK